MNLHAASSSHKFTDQITQKPDHYNPNLWTKFRWWCIRLIQSFQRIILKLTTFIKSCFFFLTSLRIISASHTVYILELENNYFYVGSTSRDVMVRWNEHQRERGGSKWTRTHRPVRLLYYERVQKRHVLGLETELTCKMMSENGINKVRGGQFCRDSDFTIYDKAIVSSLVSTMGHSLNLDYKAVDAFVKDQLAVGAFQSSNFSRLVYDGKKFPFNHSIQKNKYNYIPLQIEVASSTPSKKKKKKPKQPPTHPTTTTNTSYTNQISGTSVNATVSLSDYVNSTSVKKVRATKVEFPSGNSSDEMIVYLDDVI